MSELKGTVAIVEKMSGNLNAAKGYDGASAYEIAFKNGFWGTEAEWLESLKGKSGVYVGSGDMPDDCNVQIDPNGEVFSIDQSYNPESENAQSGVAVAEGINAKFITSAKHEEPAYGDELASDNGWTLNGWSGDFANGFTSASGNTTSLVFAMPEETGNNTYRISFRCSTTIGVEYLMVKCGNSVLFDLYGQLADPIVIGITSIENGNLEFIPSNNFTGTITDISIKRVTTRYLTAQRITDSNGELSCELRTTKAAQENIFLGKHSGVSNISGWGCAALGSEALRENTSGFWNIGIGHKALYSNTVGSRNVAIGYIALNENITGTRNIAIGTFALNHNKTGNKNIAIGADSLDKNISGSFNVAIGLQTLYENTTGESNTAVGNQSMVYNTTGVFNVAIGANALNHNTIGSYNMAMGAKTLDKCEEGNSNVAIGYAALFNCVNGSSNTAVGYNAGYGGDKENGTFKNGVFIGLNAGKSLGKGADNNIFVGVNAGSAVTTGSNNICIGNNVQPDNSSPTKGYWLNIGDLIEGDLFRTRKYVRINGGLQLSDIPTSDPNVAGRVWNDNGTLKVSAG